MSEEILKALAQLFGIITKQDGGVTPSERKHVIESFKKKLNQDAVKLYVALYDQYAEYSNTSVPEEKNSFQEEKKISVKDSLKALAICKKINSVLTQKQKIVIVIELYELAKSDEKLSAKKILLINTISAALNIDPEEINAIEYFILSETLNPSEIYDLLIINSVKDHIEDPRIKHIYSHTIEGTLYFIKIKSVNMIFLKFLGQEDIYLNGQAITYGSVHLFMHGATIKSSTGASFYYSDIVSHFRSELNSVKIALDVCNVEYKFHNSVTGLRNISISEGSGKLIGIMGASGAGKTTLLNVMAGIQDPSSGKVYINGIDIHKEKQKISGAIGYISQDDLLIEELTVYENLYYNAKLCFKDYTEVQIIRRVEKTLDNLGLLHIKHLEVGSIFNKKISGGQRKRLNIALELIREPSVLFVDEPTSGLSSRDSENVIDLLKELTLKGKLIFVVIHQPSSDVYKMFDKFLLLDTGGYMIFYGHPIEAITYFKTISRHIDHDKGQCDCCGNVNPEQIFNIVEEKVVDEYGNNTEKRKVTPEQWHQHYIQNYAAPKIEAVREAPPRILEIPSKVKQWSIFTIRDLLSKVNNRQYMVINLFESPLLALILAMIVRYRNNHTLTAYVFRFNENIPAYILMSIIVAMFMGLSGSAEEIIKDKKNLKREGFLNLSRSSYLFSKLFILFSFSAVQTLAFVLIGNSILEIKGMTLQYWAILFSISCFANVLGLMISSAFNTAIAVYILIPLLLIPQMILSGAMFNFDKVNDAISSKDAVPLLADLIASRWAFEALAVEQFKNNEYEKIFYPIEQIENISNFNIVYLLPELWSRLTYIERNKKTEDKSIKKKIEMDFKVLRNELNKQRQVDASIDGIIIGKLTPELYNEEVFIKSKLYLNKLEHTYNRIFYISSKKKEQMINTLENKSNHHLNHLKDNYYNESLSDLVRNVNTKNRILEVHGKLIPKIELIYFNPVDVKDPMDYRTHLFSPTKHLFGISISTFIFNLLAIWILTLFCYMALYFDLLKKLIDTFHKLSFRK